MTLLSEKNCSTAFLIIQNIKYSRLRKKIYNNSEDKRGKRNSNYQIPLEVEQNIREFIENYPFRESHHSSSVKTGRKYIESEKNISIHLN